jgi:hypothetical protein
MASDSPPSDNEVRWAYEVTNRVADVAVLQVIADVDANFTLTDEQIAFMNSAEVARARAICDRHRRACGVGPIDLEAGRRLPKHDLAEIEAQQLAAEAGENVGESAS